MKPFGYEATQAISPCLLQVSLFTIVWMCRGIGTVPKVRFVCLVSALIPRYYFQKCQCRFDSVSAGLKGSHLRRFQMSQTARRCP